MSYKVVGHIREHIIGHAVKKAILLVMADTANHDGSDIWLSKPTIAAETEYNISTIKRHMRELEASGKKNEGRPKLIIPTGKKRISNGFVKVYKINLEEIFKLPKTKPEDETTGVTPPPVDNGENTEETPTGVTESPDTGAEGAPNDPQQSENDPPPNPQGGIEAVFEKLWKKVLDITPEDIKTRHVKKYSLGKFEKIVKRKENPIPAGNIAHAVLWFYQSPEQTREDRKFMKGLGPVLNSENFSHFLSKGAFDMSSDSSEREDWKIRAEYVKRSGGEWPPSAPSPRLVPEKYRELFPREHWEAFGWT